MRLRRQLLFFVMCCMQAALLFAQPAPAPTREDLQARLDALAERGLPEAEQRAVQQQLEQALTQLERAAERRAELRDLQARLRDAPRLTAEVRQESGGLARADEAARSNDSGSYTGMALAGLEQAFEQQGARLAEWQQALAEANADIIAAQTRPERAQVDIAADQDRMQRIEAVLESGREDNRPLGAERRDALAAEWLALEAAIALRREQLAGNDVLLDLAQARRESLSQRIGALEREMERLQVLIAERRSEASQQAVAELAPKAGEVGGAGLLAREQAANVALSERLLQATERRNLLTERNLAARRQLDGLAQIEATLEEQIGVLHDSPLLSRILAEQRAALPALQFDSKLTDEIADLRLFQFEINQARARLEAPAAQAREVLAQAPADEVAEVDREALIGLFETRSLLLERLNRELNGVLNEAITLQLNQGQLEAVGARLRATLDEQLFWVPSNRPLDLDWLAAAPARLKAQAAAIPWRAGVDELWAGLQERPFVFLPALVLMAVLLWRRRWLAERLERLHGEINRVRVDSQLHTPLAVVLNALLVLPGPLFLGLCGLALQLDARGQNLALGNALIAMAQGWMVFHTAYRILAPGGVAERHFRWPAEEVAMLRRRVRSLGAVVVAVVGVVSVAESEPALLGDDVLGMVIVLVCYAVMTWLMGSLLHPGGGRERSERNERTEPWRMFVGVLLALMPLALIVAIVAGYYYTAIKLTGRLVDTLSLLILWRLLDGIFVRALSVAAHRLAYQRALNRREAAGREGADGEPIEEPVLDLDKVNQQSLRLVRLGLLSGLVVALYWVWADLISVFSYLDNVVLYEFAGAGGAAADMVPISLADALGALFIIVVALLLAGNLPGLLEVSLLSRLQLAQGSAYAITTLLSYLIVGVGFVAMLGTLGVSWDKLQWLVAALSVGLGFGLQEIFANFVSGLIILFERPMRIGDTVTVGNLSGTVSRIRIRATTITDFDRKEIIVPNKTFVTSQLINWSLSDTITRVTIAIGVAYGSDLELVRRLLLQAARENPRVLAEPAPMAVFLNFGASTLDHELRVHVRELGDRVPATDEINRRIDALFAEHGVEIAFAQMDVHVRSIDGKQARLQTVVLKPKGEGDDLPEGGDGVARDRDQAR